jgi:hypothetical protein
MMIRLFKILSLCLKWHRTAALIEGKGLSLLFWWRYLS